VSKDPVCSLRIRRFPAICRKKGSEPPRTRTWNLEIKSLKSHVLARARPSANYAVLQVFYEIRHSNSSIPYASVLARLQYGCSNFPALQGNKCTTKVLYNKPDDTAVHG
jgi:hypothetical protein